MLKRQFVSKVQEALGELPKNIRNPRFQKILVQWSGLIQPLWLASRVRVVKLNAQQLEVKIPLNALTRAMGTPDSMEESFLMLSANQGLKFFLSQFREQIQFLGVKDFHLEVLKYPIQSEVRFKMQLTQIEQETLRSRLYYDSSGEADIELHGNYLTPEGQMVATVNWKARVKLVRQIHS